MFPKIANIVYNRSIDLIKNQKNIQKSIKNSPNNEPKNRFVEFIKT